MDGWMLNDAFYGCVAANKKREGGFWRNLVWPNKAKFEDKLSQQLSEIVVLLSPETWGGCYDGDEFQFVVNALQSPQSNLKDFDCWGEFASYCDSNGWQCDISFEKGFFGMVRKGPFYYYDFRFAWLVTVKRKVEKVKAA